MGEWWIGVCFDRWISYVDEKRQATLRQASGGAGLDAILNEEVSSEIAMLRESNMRQQREIDELRKASNAYSVPGGRSSQKANAAVVDRQLAEAEKKVQLMHDERIEGKTPSRVSRRENYTERESISGRGSSATHDPESSKERRDRRRSHDEREAAEDREEIKLLQARGGDKRLSSKQAKEAALTKEREDGGGRATAATAKWTKESGVSLRRDNN